MTDVLRLVRRGVMKTGRSGYVLTIAWLILLVVPSYVAAQEPPDLVVSDPQFTYDVNAKLDLKGGYKGKSPGPMTTVTDSPVQRVSALFRNQGAKVIKSVVWEYVVFEDAEQTKVLHVYSIRSKRTIPAGEAVRLGKEGYHLEDTKYRKARVTRIEYKDGTTWLSTRAKT
jgi:hypothetical protein